MSEKQSAPDPARAAAELIHESQRECGGPLRFEIITEMIRDHYAPLVAEVEKLQGDVNEAWSHYRARKNDIDHQYAHAGKLAGQLYAAEQEVKKLREENERMRMMLDAIKVSLTPRTNHERSD